ncbi:Peroxisomal membrane protein 11A [Vitis vinifera]|uniref:Peroxisomal membrane protein 11A n=1 Tax=Vitis vinifera TaxID=29760 RepID=A0A438K217_VITVI|nr:Peroxisomal membrane protein 11A [Vitis vinifera]
METKAPSNLASSQNPKSSITKSVSNDRDFLNHLEAYLAKRDGVDKLLKISRYATRIILASSLLPETLTLNRRLKSFESSVGVSRKAFRLGKFVQDLNALRNTCFDSKEDVILSIIAYGGEEDQCLGRVRWVHRSISLKIRDLKRINEDESRLLSTIEISISRGLKYDEEAKKIQKMKEKRLMKRLSIVQDLADGLMALADIRDGKGRLSGPLLMSSAGLLSALISAHKNWLSC